MKNRYIVAATHVEHDFWWLDGNNCQYMEVTRDELKQIFRFFQKQFMYGAIEVWDIQEDDILKVMHCNNMNENEFLEWTQKVKGFDPTESIVLNLKYCEFLKTKGHITIDTPLGKVSLTKDPPSKGAHLSWNLMISHGNKAWKDYVVFEDQHIVQKAIDTLQAFKKTCLENKLLEGIS